MKASAKLQQNLVIRNQKGVNPGSDVMSNLEDLRLLPFLQNLPLTGVGSDRKGQFEGGDVWKIISAVAS